MWKKFLSRRFILALILVILGVLRSIAPGTFDAIPWPAIWAPLGFIVGESGVDIIREWIKYKKE